ncbi:hypothetical protein J1N35_015361 [Gossypium stocksii]|uniref:Reverse transcriptase domain-containing protein n=1 Tax=Gossypium stocksii TaxID=47602 RepID=A0A9D3VW19_9ROSI|nr:hypothetical protein J1N35_015361 [Gossypium stocksii]
MSTISSSSMQILWNGEPSRKFKPVRGIRQGCLLSSYLFVLCMKWSGFIIRKEMELGNWDPIRLSRRGPAISHLFFVDNLVIFCKANRTQAQRLDFILKQFCEFSGHKISIRKSNIFFSKTTSGDVRNQIIQMFGFQEVQNLGKYLGVPLLHERITKSTLNFIIDKVIQKLQSWDARRLSMAGRITLAQSVLLSIPNFFIQSLMIPKGPRARGGLGLRFLEDHNKSFLMKIGFSLVSKKDMLWVHVLRSKYSWKEQIPNSINRSHCSYLWKALAKIWPLFHDNLIWSLGDGSSVSCWKDPWIPGMGSLISKIPSFTNLDLDCPVRDFVNSDGSWNLNLFSVWLPDEVICKIISIPPPHPDSGPNKVIWAQSTSGAFSVHSAYWTLKEPSWNPSNDLWKRGLGHSTSCTLCGGTIEDLPHALRDCPFAKEVWMLVLPEQLKQRIVVRDTGLGATGGIASNKKGNWIVGFTRFLGVCSPFEAEVWGILDGILILLNKGYSRIMILNDNLEAVQTLSNLNMEDSGISILRRTQCIMKPEGVWKIKYIPRTHNLVVDSLAKLSLAWKSSLQILNEPPNELINLLQNDKADGWLM